jgi:CAAX protease family protein
VPSSSARLSLGGFWWTLAVLHSGLVAAGWVYATSYGVPARIAVPVVIAFLLQASLFLVPIFPEARHRLEASFRLARLALILTAASLLPFLTYSLPTGVFAWPAFVKLAAYCSAVAFLFVLAPARGGKLTWQDALALTLLALPMLGGVTFLREIYISPIPAIEPRFDRALGKLMLFPLGALAFLSLRQLPGVDLHPAPSLEDMKIGLKNYLLFLPVGAPLAMAIGFASWSPRPWDGWTYPIELAGHMLGAYLAIALPEELAFRGIAQNLLGGLLKKPLVSQLIASLLFGLVHLPSGGFPNWRYGLVAGLMGWFCGSAYAQNRSVVPAMVTHTLIVVTLRYAFQR